MDEYPGWPDGFAPSRQEAWPAELLFPGPCVWWDGLSGCANVAADLRIWQPPNGGPLVCFDVTDRTRMLELSRPVLYGDTWVLPDSSMRWAPVEPWAAYVVGLDPSAPRETLIHTWARTVLSQ